MESTCTIQEILLQVNTIFIGGMDRRKLGGYLQGEAITSFYPSVCLEECKSNCISLLVQFVIPLHRFSEEVSYGDFKASSNIKFTRTHCIGMKLYS